MHVCVHAGCKQRPERLFLSFWPGIAFESPLSLGADNKGQIKREIKAT